MLYVSRSSKNPLISPVRWRAWEALAAFNPAAVRKDDVTHLFYRAVARPDVLLTPYAGLSTIGHAVYQDDDVHDRSQIIIPEQPWEAYGCEDPRATFFEGKWYVFYTALGGFPFGPSNIKVGVAIGSSPTELTEKHLVTPFNAKAATLFPERVNGDAILLLTCHTDYTPEHPRPTIAIARAKNVEDFWNPEYWNRWHETLADHALPELRRNDSEHVEVGASPVMTAKGWLLVYSHIRNYYDEHNRLFGVEAVVLDAHDPQKVVARTPGSIMSPKESYERYGAVPNIVFPTGVVIRGDTLDLFYGAADTVCGMASLFLPDLFDAMDEQYRLNFVKRFSKNPILEPIPEHAWESRCVLNAAAVELNGETHLLYRAQGTDNTSVMGYARVSKDFTVLERLPEPAYVPREPFELKQGDPNGNSGCEDPRLTLMGDTLYLTYTAYDGKTDPRGAVSSIAVSDFLAKRFDRWALPRLLTPEGVTDKDVCLVPGKVGDKYMIIHRIDPNICADVFDDLAFSRPVNRCIEILGPRPGMWDHEKVGAAGPPIRIPEGWLFIYHAIGADKVYRLGAALLDGETATNVISRTVLPILEPVETWERDGVIGNVVFSDGMTLSGDQLAIYYGGADTALGVATVSLSALVRKLVPKLTP
ncbi:MAG TPA: hypothetical protein VHB93_00295 [Candidatus Paceibacterota bacterium]|nr:hypothetical protein [Candidatus Paceibacterota bacterium]